MSNIGKLAFSQFGSDLDAATLKQLEKESVWLKSWNKSIWTQEYSKFEYIVVNGFDDVQLDKVQDFEKELHAQLTSQYSDLLDNIESKKDLDDEMTSKLESVINDVRKLFVEEV